MCLHPVVCLRRWSYLTFENWHFNFKHTLGKILRLTPQFHNRIILRNLFAGVSHASCFVLLATDVTVLKTKV